MMMFVGSRLGSICNVFSRAKRGVFSDRMKVICNFERSYSSGPEVGSNEMDRMLKDEFSFNLEQLFRNNRYTNADFAFEIIRGQLSTKNNLNALNYFRGLFSVIEAFTETPGANTEENRRIISNFLQIMEDKFVSGDTANMMESVNVAICGAHNPVLYAMAPRIALGEMFGKKKMVNLNFYSPDGPSNQLNGLKMELDDFASPLLKSMNIFDNLEKSLEGADYVILMNPTCDSASSEHDQLLKTNAQFFSEAGNALNSVIEKNDRIRVIVSSDFPNINSMIVSQALSSKVPTNNISSVMRQQHDKGITHLAKKANVNMNDIDCFAVWGAYDDTLHPDITHAFINGQPATQVIADDDWLINTFIPELQNSVKPHGGESRANLPQYLFSGLKSNAILNHVHDLIFGTQGKWTSMIVHSNGEYGVTPGLFYSYPVVTAHGDYDIVKNLQIDEFTAEALEKSHKQLLSQRNLVSQFLS